MKKLINHLSVYCAGLLMMSAISGCHSMGSDMALANNPSNTGLSKQLLLASLCTYNADPNIKQVSVKSVSLVNLSNDSEKQYVLDAPYSTIKSKNIYLMSFSLPPGQYEISKISGHLIETEYNADFSLPIQSHFNVGEDGVVYLGAITATLQKPTEKAPDELPLNIEKISNQNSTLKKPAIGDFVIAIHNNYAADITNFSSLYPALIGQKVDKQIIYMTETINNKKSEHS